MAPTADLISPPTRNETNDVTMGLVFVLPVEHERPGFASTLKWHYLYYQCRFCSKLLILGTGRGVTYNSFLLPGRAFSVPETERAVDRGMHGIN